MIFSKLIYFSCIKSYFCTLFSVNFNYLLKSNLFDMQKQLFFVFPSPLYSLPLIAPLVQKNKSCYSLYFLKIELLTFILILPSYMQTDSAMSRFVLFLPLLQPPPHLGNLCVSNAFQKTMLPG